MRPRTLAPTLALSLGGLVLAGCTSTRPAAQPALLTAPPPGARVVPVAPPETAPRETSPPRLPD